MLKPRVIIMLTLDKGVLTRTKRFVPDYGYTLNFVDLSGADELFVIDVTPEDEFIVNRTKLYDTLRRITDDCLLPVCVGGHIATFDEVKYFFNEFPVEKVVIERELTERLAEQIILKLGQQALVSGISYSADMSPNKTYGWVASGEILFTDINRDGSLAGYDLEALKKIVALSNCPVAIAGGYGNPSHMVEAFAAGANGCVTSKIFDFSARGMGAIKKYLSDADVPVRPVAA